MAYTAEISRTNPTCFLLLVDQSGSMAEPFGAKSGKSKADGVAEAVNRLLQTLVARCAKGENILDRYYVGVIGYGGNVSPGFPIGALSGEVLQPVSRIGTNPLRVEDRVEAGTPPAAAHDRHVKFPVWFEPRAQGKTPMCGAFRAAGSCEGISPPLPQMLSADRHQRQRRRGNRRRLRARGVGDLETEVRGRQCLVVQRPRVGQGRETHLVSQQRSRSAGRLRAAIVQHVQPSAFPMLRQAGILEASSTEGARGFAFNADLASVIMFLDIGTRVGGIFGPEKTGAA